MNMKEWIALFLCIVLIVGVWCIFVLSMNRVNCQKVLTTIQPLDLTITYCDSCRKCSSFQGFDPLEFEDCKEGEPL